MIKAIVNNVPPSSSLGYTLLLGDSIVQERVTAPIFLADGVTPGDGGTAGGSYAALVPENLNATIIRWDTGGSSPLFISSALKVSNLNTAVSTPAGDGAYNPDGAPGVYCQLEDVMLQGLGLPWDKIDAQFQKIKLFFPDCADLPALITLKLIPKSESEADVMLRQTHKPTQVTQFLDGTGNDELWLPYAPVLSIDRCVIYAIPSVPFLELFNPEPVKSLGEIDPAASYGAADLLYDPETGEMRIPSRTLQGIAFTPFWNYQWLTGVKNIEVTWTYGFSDPANVPLSFRSGVACIVCVKLLEMLGLEYQGMASYKTGQTAKTIGREKNLPYSDLLARLDARVVHLLNPFKNIGV